MKSENSAYQQALDFLYSFVDYSLTRNFRYTPEKFDLGRMVDFLHLLGDPHRRFPVIHVAGTKGKGSTAAMIASSLQAAGMRVGFYTSPHLQEFTERIQIDGRHIAEQALADLVENLKPFVTQIERLTTFVISTAAAFVYFARENVDVAVIEVGLGGRLDATNVVDPLISVITSISLDHTSVLGDTLAKIAFEKAGIIKPGRPVVMAAQAPEAREVIAQVAAERGCPLIEVGRDYHFEPGAHSLEGQDFQVWKTGETPFYLQMPLLGLHQVENAAAAYAALRLAAQLGLPVTDEAIRQGFASVVWPGRFEVLRSLPPVIVDSAHNGDSAARLRQTLDDYLPGQPIVLLFGASEDKDIVGMYEALMPRVSRVIATQSVHPRAAKAGELAALAERYGRPAQAVLPLEDALEMALEQAGSAAVLATGSLFIVGAVRDTWAKRTREAGAPEERLEI